MTLENGKIEMIKTYFRTRPVLKAFVYGSYVRGKVDPDTDLDLLVELDYSQPIGLQFVQMKTDLEGMLSTHVNLLSLNGVSEHLKPVIEYEKKLIYEK